MAIDLVALQTEIQTDPTGLGYSGNTTNMARTINQLRPSILVGRGEMPTWEIIAASVKSEVDALGASDKELYLAMLSLGTVDASDTRIRAIFASLFDAATTTRQNLIDVSKREGSRAEELFGVAVNRFHISEALGV